jgi:hypothetical protein
MTLSSLIVVLLNQFFIIVWFSSGIKLQFFRASDLGSQPLYILDRIMGPQKYMPAVKSD